MHVKDLTGPFGYCEQLRLRPKLQQMSKTAEALYEQMADALAKISTAQLDPKASELLVKDLSYHPRTLYTASLERIVLRGAKLVLNLTTEGKKLP